MLCQTKISSVIMTRRDGSIRACRLPRNIFFTRRFWIFIFSDSAQGLGPGAGPGTRDQGPGPGLGTRARARGSGSGPSLAERRRNANNFRNRPHPRPSCAGAEIHRLGKPLTWMLNTVQHYACDSLSHPSSNAFFILLWGCTYVSPKEVQ